MARQHRLVISGLAHLIVLPALSGVHPFPSAADRARFLTIVHEAAACERLQVHAHALLAGEARALATPAAAEALSRWIQAIGRRYVSAYNKALGRSGTLWSGRYRCSPLQPGAWTLTALRFVDGAAADESGSTTSAAQRCGGPRDWPLADPPEYWALGNTPFERETSYADLLAEPLPPSRVDQLRKCLSGGWLCGDEAFLRDLAVRGDAARLAPRPRGRPPRALR